MSDWLKRVVKLENFPLIAALATSLFVVGLDVFGKFDRNDIPSVILFCLSVLIAGLIVERAGYFERIEKGLIALGSVQLNTGIYRVYQCRNDLPPYAGFISEAKEQVIVISIDLGETATRYMDDLAELARRRTYVRLLAFDQNSSILEGVAKLRGTSESDLRNQIGTNLNVIEQYCARLPDWQRSFIEVKLYDWTPTWGGISVDPGSAQGKMLIDVFHYGVAKGKWPEIELRTNVGDGKLCDFYSRRFLQAWADAVAVGPRRLPTKAVGASETRLPAAPKKVEALE